MARQTAAMARLAEVPRSPGGDGLLLDRGRLVVVRGSPAQLSFLKLRDGAGQAGLERTQTSDKLRGPSTVDRADGLYLVVNADFAASQRPFTVAGRPRLQGSRTTAERAARALRSPFPTRERANSMRASVVVGLGG
jgi:hypothetical protein